MLESELRYRVNVQDGPDGSSCVIQLRDAFLNYAFSDQLKDALRKSVQERVERGVRNYVMDLTAVNVMDSCGLSVLIGVRKIVESCRGRLVLVATSPILLRLFSITRLDGVFEIVPDVASAEAALHRPVGAA